MQMCVRPASIRCNHDKTPLHIASHVQFCLHRLFTLSILQSEYMPPRCCSDDAILPGLVPGLFKDEGFEDEWKKKYQEFPRSVPEFGLKGGAGRGVCRR